MEGQTSEHLWERLLIKHWKILIVFGAGVVGMVIGIFLVLFTYIENSVIGGGGEWTISQFTLINSIIFTLMLVFWELLIVGVPTGIFFGGIGYLYWSRLPEEDKDELKAEDKRKGKSTHKAFGGGGGFSILLLLAYIIKIIFIDGMGDIEFGNIEYSYFVYSFVETLFWLLVIIGIPTLILSILWLVKKLK